MSKPWLLNFCIPPDFIPKLYQIVIYENANALVITEPVQTEVDDITNIEFLPMKCKIMLGELELEVDISTLSERN